jgi:hypothetical protein
MAGFEMTEEQMCLWEEQIMFWRAHLDICIEDVFRPIKLTRIQHVIVRAIGLCDDSKICCSRGFGKTFIGGLCAAALGMLYPGGDHIMTSNTVTQATLMLEKIRMLADQNPNLANEIKPTNSKTLVATGKDGGRCQMKSGSFIKAIALESARGQRGKFLWQDESLDVNQEMYDAIAEPIKNTTRLNAITYGFKDINSKAICLTSACDKGNGFYTQFMRTVKNMAKGDYSSFACALDYMCAVGNGITDLEFFEKEKSRMPEATFDMEYGTIFLGNNSDSAFPYELIDSCRTLKKVELEQPKGSKSKYVIGLDIATSDAKGSDNSIITVVKYNERPDGSIIRKLVYVKSFNGQKLDTLAEEIRRLCHVKFPNTEKIIYDARGLGDSFDKFLENDWTDLTSGKEFPPLATDEGPIRNSASLRLLHPFRAVNTSNQRIYTNMRVAMEKHMIEFPISYRAVQQLDAEEENPAKKMSSMAKAVYLETDALQHEMGNIVAKVSSSGNVLYDVPKASQHKDRYSSLAMANDYVSEIEKQSMQKGHQTNICVGVLDYLD